MLHRLCISQVLSFVVTHPNGYQRLLLYSLAIFHTHKSMRNALNHFTSDFINQGTVQNGRNVRQNFYKNDMLYSLNSYFCNAKEAQ